MALDAPMVWFIIPWSPKLQGGVTAVVQRLQQGFSTSGGARAQIVVNDWSARQAFRGDDGAWRYRFQATGVGRWRSLLATLLRLPLALVRTRRLLLLHGVQAINFHYTDHAPAAVLLLRWLRLWHGTVVLSFHGTDVRLAPGRLARWVHRQVLNAADARVACSSSLANRLVNTFGLQRADVTVIFNGTDPSIFCPQAPLTERLTGRLPSEYIVGVGAFIPRKAHTDLLDAFALLATRHPKLHLCLAGADGHVLPLLHQRIAALRLEDRVHLFVGLSPPDVAALLARASLCVQPSLAESFPLSLLEAGAVGVPIAASAIAGHDELIVEGGTGRLFAPRDPLSCAATIERMLADTSGARAMADRLAERVRTELTWDRCVRQYAALLLGGGRGHAPTSSAAG